MTSAASTSAVITHNLSSSLNRRRFSFSSSFSSFSSSSSCLFSLKRRRTNHRNLASTKVQATSFMEIAQLGLDLDRNTVGPAVFAIATLGVSWVFYDGSMQMKQLKEELDSRGVDSSLRTIIRIEILGRWTLATNRRTMKPKRGFSGSVRRL